MRKLIKRLKLFQQFIRLHVLVYRFTRGRIGSRMRGFDVLLLTTIGRKSGKSRTVPLGFLPYHQGEYLIIASNGGQDHVPSWYFNLEANANVVVQIRDKVIRSRANILTGEKRHLIWDSHIAQTVLADYQQRTAREIPVILLQQ